MGKTVKEAIAKKIKTVGRPTAAIRRKGVITWLAISALVVLVVMTFTLRRRFFSKGKA